MSEESDLEKEVEDIKYESADSIAIVRDLESSNGMGGRGKKDILFRTEGDEEEDWKYFLGRGSRLINESFYNMWKLQEGEDDVEISKYNNLAKGIIEETDSKFDSVKILQEPEVKKTVAKFSLSNKKDTFSDYEASGKSSFVPALYAFLSDGKVEIEEDLWKSRSELEKDKKFEVFKPHDYTFTDIDPEKVLAKSSDINKEDYKKGSFSGYYTGLMGRKNEKPQNFVCFEFEGGRIYEPFRIPKNAEMLQKEFRKRLGDNTVDYEELEKTRILNEFSMPMELLKKADTDIELYLDVAEDKDRIKSYTLQEGREESEIGEVITPYKAEKAFMEVGKGTYEFPAMMINMYVPRINEEIGIKINGSDSSDQKKMMYI